MGSARYTVVVSNIEHVYVRGTKKCHDFLLLLVGQLQLTSI